MKGVFLLLFVGSVTCIPYRPYSGGYGTHSQGLNPRYFLNAQPLGYEYLSHPMASVSINQPRPMTYSHHGKHSVSQKMVGEQFFKHPGHGDDDEHEDHQSLPYSIVQDYGPYELREYPEMKFACVKSEIDNGEDPMAGLKNVNPIMLMSSKRWRKHPTSLMFMELFKYISGVNKEAKEVEMTVPVSTHHAVKEERPGGNLEVQEMCFYIPQEHQAYPPEPLETSPVYIHTRPTMRVYSLRFSGYPISSEDWTLQHQILSAMLLGKPHKQDEYYTNGYNGPHELFNRRNEVWVEDVSFMASQNDSVVDVGEEGKNVEEEQQEEDLSVEDAEVEANNEE